jgi:hypothetical protein
MKINRNISYLDTTYNPIALWNFNGVMTDSSGDGYDLSIGSGTEAYTMIRNLKGFYFNGSTYLSRAYTAALSPIGAMSFEMLINFGISTSIQGICANGNNDSSESGNSTFTLQTGPGASSFVTITYQHEYGSGTSVAYNFIANPTKFDLCHLAVTRSSDGTIVKIYYNGALIETSSALIAPTGGTTGAFRIGTRQNASAMFVPGTVLLSCKFLNKQLTDQQILNEYTRSIGNVIF